MKKLLLLLSFLGVFSLTQGQTPYEKVQELKNAQKPEVPVSLFHKSNRAMTAGLLKDNRPVASLSLDTKGLQQLQSQSIELLTLSVPTTSDTILEVELFPVSLFAPEFSIKTLSERGETQVPVLPTQFFRGIIKDDSTSVVSIGIVNGELSGLISNSQGTRVLGKLKSNNPTDTEYMLYHESDLSQANTFSCSALLPEGRTAPLMDVSESQDACSGRQVNIYFETDKSMYNAFNGSTGVQNYVLALFSQVATLYSNENINIRLSGLGIWVTDDPYLAANSTDGALTIFKNLWNAKSNNFPGQLAHLLTRRSLGGGIAYIDVLCGLRSYAYGVSGISGYFYDVPTYSWDVMVIAHELGHNFGSQHTQSCSWPGGAIDNCYTTEGGCPPGPAPINGGTIMSYCHLTGYGINLANGFGPLPGNFIRNRYNAASCLNTFSTSPPTALSTSQILGTRVVLNWSHPSDHTAHTVQYRPQSSTGDWTEVHYAVSGFSLTGLTPNTAYSWRVKGECSDYSAIATFSTNNISDPYCEPLSDCTDSDGFNSFTLNGQLLSNNSGCSSNGFNYFSNAPVVPLTSGSSYPFQAQLLSSSWIQHVKIWIDYNKDNVFSDDEVVFETSSSVTGTFSGTLSVAANKSADTTRMRIRSKYQYPITTACEIYTYGETEDYPVQILAPLSICESLASGAWNSTATWSCGRVPLATDEVVIRQGHTVTLTTTASAKRVEIQANSQLQYGASGTLQIGF